MSDYAKDKPFTPKNFFDELTIRMEETPEERKKDDLEQLIKFISGDKFMATDFPEQEWLVEGVLPDKGMICLSGMPSSYKSWFGFYLALCVMKGKTILEEPLQGRPGWKTDKGAVLFIDKENIEKQIQERMKMLGAGAEMKNCYFAQGNFSTENLHSVAEIVKFVKENKIRLVVIDSLIRIHSRNENDAVEMNKVFERLAEIQHAGAAVLYLHHLRKATTFTQDPMERLRGSIDISARLDSLIAFDNDEKNIIKVTHGKSRYGEAFPPFLMRFEVDQNNKAYFNFDRELEAGQIEQLQCTDAVYALLEENSFTRQHLLESLSKDNGGIYTRSAVDDALRSLKLQGRIETKQAGRETIYTKSALYELAHRKLTDEEKENLH